MNYIDKHSLFIEYIKKEDTFKKLTQFCEGEKVDKIIGLLKWILNIDTNRRSNFSSLLKLIEKD